MTRPILTPRQFAVLALVAEGYTNDQIARRLGTTKPAVRQRLERICANLACTTARAAVVHKAWQLGILTHDGLADSVRAAEVMSELLDASAEPIQWQTWERLLGPRYESRAA
jgi:DNA-binding CsgD family transcriptional regulator